MRLDRGQRGECARLALQHQFYGAHIARLRQPDIALAREKLRWEPQMELREGLIKTIAYFDEMLTGYGQVPE